MKEVLMQNQNQDVEKLYGEMSQCNQEIVTLFNMGLSLTAVILGTALTAKNGYIPIAAFVVIIPVNMLVLERLKNLWRCAAYLRVFWPETMTKWEYYIDVMRREEKRLWPKLPLQKTVFLGGYIFLISGSGLVCAITSFVLLWINNAFWPGFAVLISWTIISIPFSYWAWNLRGGGKVEKGYEELWEEIKNNPDLTPETD